MYAWPFVTTRHYKGLKEMNVKSKETMLFSYICHIYQFCKLSELFNFNAASNHLRGVLRKSCSKKMQQIYRRTLMPKCDFNKAAKLLYWNQTLAWVFSCNLAAYFQSTFCNAVLRMRLVILQKLLFLKMHSFE